MQNQYLQYGIPIFVLLIALEAVYARYKGLKLYRLNDSIASLGCGAFTVTLEVFIKVALIGLYTLIYQHYALTDWSLEHWQSWLAALLVYDFIYYWAHRLSHEINFMWGGHVPHHQSEEYNLSTAIRQGALQDLMQWPLFLPMAVMGFGPELFVAQIMISKFTQFPLHTRTIGKIPFVEGILNTPSAHRVHHGMNDGYIDKNHGGLLMIWDRLFGTYAAEEEAVIYGVRNPYYSFDSVWAHFDWLALLWRDAKATHAWKDKFKLWFMPTGWRPADVEARLPRPKLQLEHFHKFEIENSPAQQRTAIGLFLVVVGLTNVLVIFHAELDWGIKALLALLISLGLWKIGQVLRAPAATSESGDCLDQAG